jgi:hypothetical protein
MIDLEYLTEELKTDGVEVAVLIDANETLDHRFRSQNHDHKYKSDKVFHIDISIDGSIAVYTHNCGLSNTLSGRHAETGTDIPNTHLRGSKQIGFVLTTAGIAPFIQAIGLLDFGVVFRTDHRTFFIEIQHGQILWVSNGNATGTATQATAIRGPTSCHGIQESSSPAIYPSQRIPSNQRAIRVQQIGRMEHITGVQV